MYPAGSLGSGRTGRSKRLFTVADWGGRQYRAGLGALMGKDGFYRGAGTGSAVLRLAVSWPNGTNINLGRAGLGLNHRQTSSSWPE